MIKVRSNSVNASYVMSVTFGNRIVYFSTNWKRMVMVVKVIHPFHSLEILLIKYKYWQNIRFILKIFSMKCHYYRNILFTLKYWQWNREISPASIASILPKCKHPNDGTVFNTNIRKVIVNTIYIPNKIYFTSIQNLL